MLNTRCLACCQEGCGNYFPSCTCMCHSGGKPPDFMNWHCRRSPKSLKTHVLTRWDHDWWVCANCGDMWTLEVLEMKGQVLSLADFGRLLVEEGGTIL